MSPLRTHEKLERCSESPPSMTSLAVTILNALAELEASPVASGFQFTHGAPCWGIVDPHFLLGELRLWFPSDLALFPG